MIKFYPPAFGPRSAAPTDTETRCAACDALFKEGDYTTIIPLGPGSDEENRRRCREGRVYNAVAVEVHYACAHGFEFDPTTRKP